MPGSARAALRRAGQLLVSTRLRALLSAGVLLGLLSVSARAQWTDSATATASFSTGSIDLRLGAAQVDDGPAETATLAMADMAPGDSVTATLLISNVGTVPLTYSMTSSAPGALAAALRLSVYAGPCGDTDVIVGASLATATFGERALTGNGGAAPSEDLCFEVFLPGDAPSSLQGTTASATFTFTAVSS